MQWVHLKTGEVTGKNPGHKYFKVNAKAMRKRAEEKFQKDLISRVEKERELIQMKTERERDDLARRSRFAHKRNIVQFYSFYLQ